jgi:hypothetical protein
MPNTQKDVIARPDRAVACNYQEVEAHGAKGADLMYTKDQTHRAHELGAVKPTRATPIERSRSRP